MPGPVMNVEAGEGREGRFAVSKEAESPRRVAGVPVRAAGRANLFAIR